MPGHSQRPPLLLRLQDVPLDTNAALEARRGRGGGPVVAHGVATVDLSVRVSSQRDAARGDEKRTTPGPHPSTAQRRRRARLRLKLRASATIEPDVRTVISCATEEAGALTTTSPGGSRTPLRGARATARVQVGLVQNDARSRPPFSVLKDVLGLRVLRDGGDASDRVFCCRRCRARRDRDLNAAVNLAAWADAEQRPTNKAPELLAEKKRKPVPKTGRSRRTVCEPIRARCKCEQIAGFGPGI
jgi:hypothetical protein